MQLRSMSADPKLVSTPKLLATGDYTESYTMINSVNALVVCDLSLFALKKISLFSKMWFKIFKYISITKRLTRISKALFKALPDVSAFFFVFVVLFIGFGISAHLLFGNDIVAFSSVGETFLTLFRMMLGDWDFEAMVLSAPIMGPVCFLFHKLSPICRSLRYNRYCLYCGFALLQSFCSTSSSVYWEKLTIK